MFSGLFFHFFLIKHAADCRFNDGREVTDLNESCNKGKIKTAADQDDQDRDAQIQELKANTAL